MQLVCKLKCLDCKQLSSAKCLQKHQLKCDFNDVIFFNLVGTKWQTSAVLEPSYIYISKLWISWLSIITSHYIAYKTIIFVVTSIIPVILRVMEWLRHVDLSEYAPNLRGSGVHGALLVFESRW